MDLLVMKEMVYLHSTVNCLLSSLNLANQNHQPLPFLQDHMILVRDFSTIGQAQEVPWCLSGPFSSSQLPLSIWSDFNYGHPLFFIVVSLVSCTNYNGSQMLCIICWTNVCMSKSIDNKLNIVNFTLRVFLSTIIFAVCIYLQRIVKNWLRFS